MARKKATIKTNGETLARLLITVHGIRTFGKWQERLGDLVQNHSGGSIDVLNYRYGFFSLFAFMVPPLRWIAVKRFQAHLVNCAKSREWSRIDIVAHSFGTHLVAWGLLRLPAPNRPKIDTLILSGSVLKQNFEIFKLADTVRRVVNDCGIRDKILILNQLVTLFTGAAGRTGINGMEGSNFTNRYFNFGHSGYFDETEPGTPNFMSKYWLPILTRDGPVVRHDDRKPSRWNDFITPVLNNFEPIKISLYGALLFGTLLWVNHLRLKAENQAKIASSRQLASESLLLQKENADLDLAALLAIESMRLYPQLANDEALRDAIEFMPRQLWITGEPSRIVSSTESADGRYIAVGSDDGYARVYDTQTGRSLSKIQFPGPVNTLAFNPTGEYLMGASREYFGIFESVTGNKTTGIKFRSTPASIAAVFSVAFSPDGQIAAILGGNLGLTFYRTDHGRLTSTVSNNRDVVTLGLDIEFSPSGKYLLIKGRNSFAAVIEVETGKRIALPGVPATNTIAFSPDETYLAVAHYEDGVTICRLDCHVPIALLAKGNRVVDFHFSPDGLTLLIATEDNLIYVIDTQSWEKKAEYKSVNTITSLVFTKDGRHFLTAETDRTMRVHLTQTGNEVSRYTLPEGINPIRLSHDESKFISVSAAGIVRCWQTISKKQNIVLDLQHATLIGSSPDRRYALVKDGGGPSRVVDIKSGQTVSVLEDGTEMYNATFSPDNRYVVTRGRELGASEFDTATGTLISKLNGLILTATAFSPDSQTIAIGSSDFALWTFSAKDGVPLQHVSKLGYIDAIAFSPDNRYLVTGSTYTKGFDPAESTASIFDVTTGTKLRSLPSLNTIDVVMFSPNGKYVAIGEGGTNRIVVFTSKDGVQRSSLTFGQRVNTLSFGPDSRLVAATAYDNTLRLFEADSGREVVHFSSNPLPYPVQFTTDGKQFVTTAFDGAVLIETKHFIESRDLIDVACTLVTRNLTREEWDQYVGSEFPFHKTCNNVP